MVASCHGRLPSWRTLRDRWSSQIRLLRTRGIRESDRLVAGLNTRRQNVLLIKDKVASGTTVEDTETLVMALRSGPLGIGHHAFAKLAVGRPLYATYYAIVLTNRGQGYGVKVATFLTFLPALVAICGLGDAVGIHPMALACMTDDGWGPALWPAKQNSDGEMLAISRSSVNRPGSRRRSAS
jgi:hypothetical protein